MEGDSLSASAENFWPKTIRHIKQAGVTHKKGIQSHIYPQICTNKTPFYIQEPANTLFNKWNGTISAVNFYLLLCGHKKSRNTAAMARLSLFYASFCFFFFIQK